MVWGSQATSNFLCPCWPRFMSPYSITGSQWVEFHWNSWGICNVISHCLKPCSSIDQRWAHEGINIFPQNLMREWKQSCYWNEIRCGLTHWGRVTHIFISKLTIIGSDNGLSPGRRQAIIWTNAGILLIGPLVTNFSEILRKIHTFSFKKIYLKMSSGKWRPFCLVLNVLTTLSVSLVTFIMLSNLILFI